MKSLLFSLLLLAGLCPVPALKAGVVYTFDDPSLFDTQFQVRRITGNASSVSLLSGPSRVQLHAQQDTATLSTTSAGAFSEASSEFDFISSPKTFTFSNVAFSFAASGATYSAEVGVFAKAQGSIVGSISTNPGNGVYLFFDRFNSQLAVRQLKSGSFTTLAYWSIPNLFNFSSITLTLDSSSWSLVAVRGDNGTTYTNANATGGSHIGTFTTSFTSANWGSNFYLGMEANETSGGVGRFANLTLEQIAIPEAKTAMLMLMALGAAALSKRGRSLVKWRGGR